VNILVANIGSTSFKYRVFDPNSQVLAQGRAERVTDYGVAIRACMADIAAIPVAAVGFKAVHAGPLTGAQIVTEEVLAQMERFSFFAPAHNPPYIAAMRSFAHELPGTPLVALFETAFFQQVPEAATTYAVPFEWRVKYGVQRYGFHGASHRAASERAQELMRRTDLRHISCHLGGSSSLAAIRNGIAIDTSFGMSPQCGLPQSNRTGDLDVFAALYVMQQEGYSPEQMASILGSQSGLAGMSGTSGDMRDLEGAALSGNANAQLAIDAYAYNIRRYIGSFLVALGGLDILTFSGGIGENSPALRDRICADLEEFGISLDPSRNAEARSEAWISEYRSKVRVQIVPADEERIVARATAEALTARGAHAS
jgi:acetate kinase